ncbi:SusC/RagA family protein [Lewinellaceae bacterium SD302]|nr:SusC/RagA family protein [Lewinellaceae bacterium SD302]
MRLSLRRVLPLLVALFMGSGLYAQYTLNGTITESSGEPLIGVSILIEGTTTGTVSDLDGKFTLSVPANADALVLSYTGFATKLVPLDPSMTIVDITMDEDVARLDEVVVTGLASGVKRANSGNSVATISSAELTGQTQIQTVDGALNGKLAGVNIAANGGAPGGGINVQLRGVSTLGSGSSQPLYIIDGVYVNNSSIRNGRSQVSGATGGASSSTQDNAANRIADINPDDIERIEVLKGPSAAAIYGTRANSGVILITTKRGKAGKTQVSFSQDIGFAQGQNFQNFSEFDRENLTARGVDQSEFDALAAAEAAGTIVDWEEEMYGETPILSNSRLSISGGSQNTQFYVSGGVTTEDGIIQNTGFDRYTIRANIDQRLGNKIRIALNTNYAKSDTDRGFTGNQNNTGGSLGYAIAYTPTYASLQPDAEGNYPDNPYFNDNPYAIRDLATNNQVVDRFITAAVLDIDIFSTANSFLKFKANGGVDFLGATTLVHFPEILQHQQARALPGDVTHGRTVARNTNLQAFLNFNTNLGTINSNTSVGVVRLDQTSEFLLQRGEGLTAGQTNLAFAQVSSTLSQFDETQSDLGYVLQEDLNWDDKIAASFGIRLDKSTLNLQQNELYTFLKGSLALNLHNFDFLADGPFSQFKLRSAYGQTGGLPRFGETFTSLNGVNIDGNLGVTAALQGVDPNLEPETANEFEIGADIGIVDNRIVFEGTYYQKNVNDLLLRRQLAESVGVTDVITNAADLQNEGFELGLTLNPVRGANFDWTSRILYWQNRSEITRLDIPAFTQGGFGPSLGTYILAEGLSPTTIVGNPNDPDLNSRSLGFTILGDRQPDYTMTWFNTFQIAKNFDLGFLLHYQNGGKNINLSALLWDDGGSTPNWAGDDDGDGDPNGLDRLLDWSGRPATPDRDAIPGRTEVYVQPTDYVKLREVSLYYTLPNGVIGGDLLKRLKIGVSANNLLLWTEYGSYDPEVSNFGTQAITSAIEVTPYPSARRIFFHLKADF